MTVLVTFVIVILTNVTASGREGQGLAWLSEPDCYQKRSKY